MELKFVTLIFSFFVSVSRPLLSIYKSRFDIPTSSLHWDQISAGQALDCLGEAEGEHHQAQQALPWDAQWAWEVWKEGRAGMFNSHPILQVLIIFHGRVIHIKFIQEKRETSTVPKTEDRLRRLTEENKKLIHLVTRWVNWSTLFNCSTLF